MLCTKMQTDICRSYTTAVNDRGEESSIQWEKNLCLQFGAITQTPHRFRSPKKLFTPKFFPEKYEKVLDILILI